jgi:hypothetical protein
MRSACIVTGILTDDRTVTLDERVSLKSSKVRVTIESLSPPPTRSASEVLADIWAAQDLRGYVPRTREQIDADIEQERNSWGD